MENMNQTERKTTQKKTLEAAVAAQQNRTQHYEVLGNDDDVQREGTL